MSSSDLNMSLTSLLKCPSCSDYLVAPIRQCASGHSICSECFLDEPDCPICEMEFIDARNYALEQIAEKATVSCPYSSQGCKFTSVCVKMNDHIKCCDYRDHRCCIRHCGWTGPQFSIVEHVKTNHPSQIFKKNTALEIPKSWTSTQDNIWDVFLVQGYKHLFWLHLKLEGYNGKIMCSVQQVSSESWKYEIKMMSDHDMHMSRMVTASADTNMNSIFTKEYCFSVSTKLAKHFVVDNCIKLHLNVSKIPH